VVKFRARLTVVAAVVMIAAVWHVTMAQGARMFEFEGKFESVRELLERDAREPLPDEELDDQLWLLLTKRIESPRDLRGLPPEIGIYFASRYLQWEVGNGGFAQAASNIPEWFALAETGYGALGQPASAALIKEARMLLSDNEHELAEREAQLEKLDAKIPQEGWEIDAERVRYVRQHRTAFQAVR
jgi:hypothetical protein